MEIFKYVKTYIIQDIIGAHLACDKELPLEEINSKLPITLQRIVCGDTPKDAKHCIIKNPITEVYTNGVDLWLYKVENGNK